MMLVISDTTSLIGLSMISRLELLKILFSAILIPSAVHNEIVVKGAGRFGVDEVAKAVADGWMKVENVASDPVVITLKIDLDDGEAEAIALALVKQADLLLLDERKARAKAKALGLAITGTIGVLLLAREKGVTIDLQSELKNCKITAFELAIHSSKK
jgi:predicted nucleic acid-binding protein